MDLAPVKPVFIPSDLPESPRIQSMIETIGLIPHVEGGYYKQTDASAAKVSVPAEIPSDHHTVSFVNPESTALPDTQANTRHLSTTIFYYLTPRRPQGSFHANRSRIIHTLHKGRGRYVLIHPSGRIETFVVGQDIEAGEKLQWVVEGGVWKASFLLETPHGQDGQNEGLLITETVVPGFAFVDHEFLSIDKFQEMVSTEINSALSWLVRDGRQFDDESPNIVTSVQDQDMSNAESGEGLTIGGRKAEPQPSAANHADTDATKAVGSNVPGLVQGQETVLALASEF